MIFHSPSPAVDIPDCSWSNYFFENIEPYQNKPALVDGSTGCVITYSELKIQIRSVAVSLQQKGYLKGDVFAIYAPNSPEYVITFQAVLMIGGVITTANPLYTANELAHQLEHSNAACLFTSQELIDKANIAIKSSSIRETYVFGEEDGVNSFDQLLHEKSNDQFTEVSIDPNKDTAVLPYSSGTTGLPKGVMLTHRNLIAHNVQAKNQIDATNPSEKDTLIAVLPFFHIFGMTVNMNLGLTSGSTLVIMRGFEPTQFLQLIEKYRVSIAYLVPPIILFLGSHPSVDDHDISSLKYILSGAAPLGEDQVQSISERIDCSIVQGYGLTETSPVTHRIPDLSNTEKPGSVGVLVPNTEAKILDTETGKTVGFDETGELLMRGPQIMPGYLNNPTATAETIDEDCWLHTGDIAYADEDGYFHIVDRLKELIKVKGFQVAPAELEALLLTHPAVADVAVVPQPDEKTGEIPKAFIVLKKEISTEEIMAWVAEKVAPYKKIKEIEFIDQIPKSPSGKILRRLLR